MHKMRKFLLLSLLFSNLALAEGGFVKGTIEYVRIHEEGFSSWSPPSFWFTLNEVASFGECKTFHGNVLFTAKGEMFFSMILATQQSGGELAVRVDDSVVGIDGYCRARYITTGNPPIIY